MAGPGFIQDQLELKVLILYIAARVVEPIPYDTLWDLTLCDSGIDYFEFSTCVTDLVRTEHLTKDQQDLYAITEKGRRNSVICESNLAYSVKQHCEKTIRDCNRKITLHNQVRASNEQRENGTYTVTLHLEDDMGSILELNLMAVNQEMAQGIQQRFLDNPQQIYGGIMDVLLSTGQCNDT